MVLLIAKFAKFYSKLENHHHHRHQSEELSASLEVFESKVSNFLSRLALSWNPRSESPSFSWVLQCLELLPIINKAFAKLVVDIDYPMSKWEAGSVEGYLNYSLDLLDFFNSIASSVSHLRQERLSLSHGLGLLENNSPSSSAIKHLKAISPRCFNKEYGKDLLTDDGKGKVLSSEELVIHQALMEIKTIGLWVCGVVLSGLSIHGDPYMEMRKKAGGFVSSSIIKLDSSICEHFIEKGAELKEVKELNGALACLVSEAVNGRSDFDAKELQEKVEMFGKVLEDIGEVVDNLFANVLAERNQLIGCLRMKK